MSIVRCENCEAFIDSDHDADCFVETGNMRRLHQISVLCESCRDEIFARDEQLAAADQS